MKIKWTSEILVTNVSVALSQERVVEHRMGWVFPITLRFTTDLFRQWIMDTSRSTFSDSVLEWTWHLTDYLIFSTQEHVTYMMVAKMMVVGN